MWRVGGHRKQWSPAERAECRHRVARSARRAAAALLVGRPRCGPHVLREGLFEQRGVEDHEEEHEGGGA